SCMEFHGEWGSLVISQGHYRGFLPFENEIHICVVIGAPVLYFRNNDFLLGQDSNIATQAIYERWATQNKMDWVNDLSGPFTILLINKKTSLITAVTDLMGFIPVYSCLNQGEVYLGTHVDALAKATGENGSYDSVSLADFILTDVVTFPYTVYSALRQEVPGSELDFSVGHKKQTRTYWLPIENNPYNNIDEAADALRHGIKRYIDTVTEKMPRLAQFISAGEDSRALSGLLPPTKPRDAYIFLDHMNREGKIAKKVASAYDAKFHVGYRDSLHYLDIVPEASTLVGLGHQYSHAHSLGFDKEFKLSDYDAVFGGYLADSLLKGAYVPKLRGSGRFPFLPDIVVNRSPIMACFRKSGMPIKEDLKKEIEARKKEHFDWIKELRPNSVNEWFMLYPASMRITIPNFYSTRRLFKSYEPFLSHEIVKGAAKIPINWKLNRKVFHRVMRPYLKKSQWIFHADGRLPYYPWWFNAPIQAYIWLTRQLKKRMGARERNQGPWGDWKTVFSSDKWRTQIEELNETKEIKKLFKDGVLLSEITTATNGQQVNLMQTLWQLNYSRYNHKCK